MESARVCGHGWWSRRQLQSLFEAARWAPSSSNEQPWHFIVGTKADPSAHDRLVACLKEGNRKWAFRAPVLISVRRTTEF
jgi:nitroreductase